MGSRGVILDRDGTLIDFVRDQELGVVTPAFHPTQLRLLPGVLEGLARLRDAGFTLAIATNQPDAAKGKVSAAAIERTNRALVELLGQHDIPIAALVACLHHPEGGPGGDPALVGPCSCRKPQPGMLLRLCAELDLAPALSWMVGDTEADLRAAQAAGLQAALLVPERRCELCPIGPGPLGGPAPALVADRFDRLAAAILGVSAVAIGGKTS